MPTSRGMSGSRKPTWEPVMPDIEMEEAAPKSTTGPGAAAPVLAVQDLQAWYGEAHIIHVINYNVIAAEVVTLLGRNGAGKPTTLKWVMSIIATRTDSVRSNGQ